MAIHKFDMPNGGVLYTGDKGALDIEAALSKMLLEEIEKSIKKDVGAKEYKERCLRIKEQKQKAADEMRAFVKSLKK